MFTRVFELLRTTVVRLQEQANRRRIAREMDEEFRFHIDTQVEKNIAHGMTPEHARRSALLAFGSVQRFREDTLASRGVASLDAIARDTRMSMRRLARARGFTAGVVATLSVSLAAATGIGTIVYGVMLNALPYPEPHRLVRIDVSTPGLGINTLEQSSGTFVYFAEHARSFSAMGAVMVNEGVVITDGNAPERVVAAIITPNMFGMLGVEAVVGRLFRDDDALADTVDVLISHDLWQTRYGGDPAIAGKSIELNRGRRTILGVLPRGFAFPTRSAAIYYPEHVQATRATLSDRHLTVIGRLAPDVTVAQAQAELDRLATTIHEQFTELTAETVRESGLRVSVQRMRDAIVAPVRAELTLLALMVVAFLLIAIANVTTLSLLRAERLRGEVAIARALGAGSASLMRRFLIEGIMIGLASSLVALPLVVFALSIRFGFTSVQVPRLEEVAFGPPTIVALVALSVPIGILLGLASMARAGGVVTAVALRENSRATRGRAWRHAQRGLVALQIAAALALLLGAGLLGSSLVRLHGVDIGFDQHHASKFSIALPFRAYPNYQRAAAFHNTVLESLRGIPGVTGVAAAMQFPSTPQLLYTYPLVETRRADGQMTQANVNANVVSPAFFQVMRIPLRAGRTFEAGDLANATPGVIISTTLARELFGDEDPVGKEVRIASSRRYPPYRVVGVSGDVYADRVADGVLRTLYFPLLGDLASTSADTARLPFVPAGMHFVVRSEAPVSLLAPMFRRAVATADPRVPVWDIRTLEHIVADSTANTRLTMTLLALAALATLLLSTLGLYSVIAYAVAGRSREFAVRLALGATSAGIMRIVFREGAAVAVVGMIAGGILSLVTTRILRSMLFEVGENEARVYAIAVAVVVCAAVLASYVPARRAGNGDPAEVLRAE